MVEHRTLNPQAEGSSPSALTPFGHASLRAAPSASRPASPLRLRSIGARSPSSAITRREPARWTTATPRAHSMISIRSRTPSTSGHDMNRRSPSQRTTSGSCSVARNTMEAVAADQNRDRGCGIPCSFGATSSPEGSTPDATAGVGVAALCRSSSALQDDSDRGGMCRSRGRARPMACARASRSGGSDAPPRDMARGRVAPRG
jgi:hypothetical protein